MSALARCTSIAGLGATLCLCLPGAGFAADTSGAMASSCQPQGYIERRVVQKAQIGVEALRDYVYITRGIHALNLQEVAASLDAWMANAHSAGMSFDEQAVRQTVALAAKTPR
jgi:hypothetical protein